MSLSQFFLKNRVRSEKIFNKSFLKSDNKKTFIYNGAFEQHFIDYSIYFKKYKNTNNGFSIYSDN